MKFSDAQIESILKSVEVALTAYKIRSPTKQGVRLELKSYLSESGVVENVCAYCLGSGKKEIV